MTRFEVLLEHLRKGFSADIILKNEYSLIFPTTHLVVTKDCFVHQLGHYGLTSNGCWVTEDKVNNGEGIIILNYIGGLSKQI